MANDMQTTQQRRTNPVAAFIDEIRQPSYLKTYGELLPEGVAPERFVRSVVTAVTADPSLLNCNRKSLFFAIRKAAQLGLDCSGVNGEGWLVQVNKKGQQEKNVEYWIGYRGHIKLARQSGEISSFECEIIHETDHVVYKGGITPIFEVEFNWKDPGEPVAVYAVARFKDGGHQLKVIGKAELTEIKTRAIGNRKFTPWNTDEPAMWRKTALHRLCSLLPTSAVDLRVIDADHYVQHEESSGLGARLLAAPDDDDDAPVRRPRRSRKKKDETPPPEEQASEPTLEAENPPVTDAQRASRMDAVADSLYTGGGDVIEADAIESAPESVLPDDVGDPGPSGDGDYDTVTGETYPDPEGDDGGNDIS